MFLFQPSYKTALMAQHIHTFQDTMTNVTNRIASTVSSKVASIVVQQHHAIRRRNRSTILVERQAKRCDHIAFVKVAQSSVVVHRGLQYCVIALWVFWIEIVVTESGDRL
uniref:AlNc14C391G11287 protein n=1 Tax=Albugo laibachii Nc14 TaxID=890382 RepID=F0WYM3_9STRA|nr:AlNc14C391G11287 [Albugo laibachii Nc14]|eukprot:CCA26582.1 AlNc14C391G11287 [Albugo laibachii Nc14]